MLEHAAAGRNLPHWEAATLNRSIGQNFRFSQPASQLSDEEQTFYNWPFFQVSSPKTKKEKRKEKIEKCPFLIASHREGNIGAVWRWWSWVTTQWYRLLYAVGRVRRSLWLPVQLQALTDFVHAVPPNRGAHQIQCQWLSLQLQAKLGRTQEDWIFCGFYRHPQKSFIISPGLVERYAQAICSKVELFTETIWYHQSKGLDPQVSCADLRSERAWVLAWACPHQPAKQADPGLANSLWFWLRLRHH